MKVVLAFLLVVAFLAAGCAHSRGVAPGTTPVQVRDMDQERASGLVALSLACVGKEFPNKPSHVYHDASEVAPPSVATPVFHGCFDWHSAVHGHWAMVRVLKAFPDLPEGPAIREVLARHLRPELVATEAAFFAQERSATFERPYGLAWLLRLADEIRTWDDPLAPELAAALAPLERMAVERLSWYLPRLTVPVRAGTHNSTAFAMIHALDHARATGNRAFESLLVERARAFFLADRDCPTAYEPSGEDFVSPCLTEADLMRRVLPRAEFRTWLDSFLPPMDSDEFRPLRTPVEVLDRHDPRIGHLIGLSLQRAWSYRGIASALDADDPRTAAFQAFANLHQHDGLHWMFDSGYGGEHWLASFAIFLVTGAGGG
jgi:hypothetical protein